MKKPVEELLASTGRYSYFFLDQLETSQAPEALLFQLFLFSVTDINTN